MAIEIQLEPQHEKVAESCPYDLRQGHMPLYHQMRTVDALKQSPLVMNTYNTGTGRHWPAFSTFLNWPSQTGSAPRLTMCSSLRRRMNPSGTTRGRHPRAFVAEYDSPFRVLEVNAQRLRVSHPSGHSKSPRERSNTTDRLIRWHVLSGLGQHRTSNASLLSSETNLDLFFYSSFGGLLWADQRKDLFQTFVLRFRYVVIDEFHYYNSKQLANFLFFIIFFPSEWGYLDQRNRKICLLSATPNASTVIDLTGCWEKTGGNDSA